ncbi:hypothetical protein WA158_004977 [Blastocystis sp. Blastoise]
MMMLNSQDGNSPNSDMYCKGEMVMQPIHTVINLPDSSLNSDSKFLTISELSLTDSSSANGSSCPSPNSYSDERPTTILFSFKTKICLIFFYISLFLIGYDFSCASWMIEGYHNASTENYFSTCWWNYGFILGCLFMVFIRNYLCRKQYMIFGHFIYFVGTFFFIVDNISMASGYFMKGFICISHGIGISLIIVSSIVYIHEISPPKYRGYYVILILICILNGSVLAQLLISCFPSLLVDHNRLLLECVTILFQLSFLYYYSNSPRSPVYISIQMKVGTSEEGTDGTQAVLSTFEALYEESRSLFTSRVQNIKTSQHDLNISSCKLFCSYSFPHFSTYLCFIILAGINIPYMYNLLSHLYLNLTGIQLDYSQNYWLLLFIIGCLAYNINSYDEESRYFPAYYGYFFYLLGNTLLIYLYLQKDLYGFSTSLLPLPFIVLESIPSFTRFPWTAFCFFFSSLALTLMNYVDYSTDSIPFDIGTCIIPSIIFPILLLCSYNASSLSLEAIEHYYFTNRNCLCIVPRKI